jgi:hypothetical protein
VAARPRAQSKFLLPRVIDKAQLVKDSGYPYPGLNRAPPARLEIDPLGWWPRLPR